MMPLRRAAQLKFDISFVRYAVIGIVLNASFLALMVGGVVAGLRGWQAILVLYPFAVTASFVANRSWSFSGRVPSRLQFAKYVLVYAAAYPISIGLAWRQELMGIPPLIAAFLATAVVTGAIFLLLNFWVFAAPSEQPSPA